MKDPHKHVPRLVQSRHINLHGDHVVGRLNQKIALKSSALLSNMWFFWFCVGLDVIEGFFLVQQFSFTIFVAYIAQTVIQLLALPILGASQNLIQAMNDAKAETDHETLQAIHSINVTQTKILKELRSVVKS